MLRASLSRELLPVLFEDDDFVAVEKPWGIDTGTLAGQNAEGVAEIIARVRGLEEPYEPINRLSRYESGVLLLGKNPTVAEAVRSALKRQKVSMEYIAVVAGALKSGRATIEAQHGTSRGRSRVKQQRGGAATKAPIAASATTIQTLHIGERRSLIRCRTSASTTHALRAQLRAVRLRVLGDPIHQRFGRPMAHQMTCLHLARITFDHPRQGRGMTVSAKPPDVFSSITDGERDVSRPLQAALVRRVDVLSERDIDAYRLLTGEAEDFPGLTAERFGPLVILEVQRQREAVASSLKTVAMWYRDRLGVESVVARWNVKELGGEGVDGSDGAALTPIIGRSIPESIEIRERGLKFLIRPTEGRSVGLYLDHRDNRSRIRSMARGKSALNLFAYTCGFSAAAASGGASSTVSVDLSHKYLDWGRHNFELNNLGLEAHEFVQADSIEYIRQARRRERRFDLIVIDPPSFAHGRRRGRDFSISRDLSDLVAAALDVLEPEGVMMVATNLRKMSLSGMREAIKRAAGKRKVYFLGAPPLPSDYAVDPYHAKTIYFSLSAAAKQRMGSDD
jgi:23S rRNA (cytosine1962-C5)-methyltransferase